MRIACFLAVAFLAGPAAAGTPEEIAAHGMVVTIGGFDIDLDFKPDHTFTGANGQVTGTWRIEGDRLCSKSNLDPAERCEPYPAGKKSGDSFQVTDPEGRPVVIRIK